MKCFWSVEIFMCYLIFSEDFIYALSHFKYIFLDWYETWYSLLATISYNRLSGPLGGHDVLLFAAGGQHYSDKLIYTFHLFSNLSKLLGFLITLAQYIAKLFDALIFMTWFLDALASLESLILVIDGHWQK